MEQKSFFQKVILPVVVVLATMIVAGVVYLHLAWRLGSGGFLGPIVSTISAVLFFASIGFGTLYIYPTSYFRGASVAERIAACLVTPVIWNLKEMVRVSEFFSFGEILYHGVNTVFLLAIFGALGQMGLCELICRWRLGKRVDEPAPIFSPAPVIAILAGFAALYVCLLWGFGVHFFYLYIDGYKAIFA